MTTRDRGRSRVRGLEKAPFRAPFTVQPYPDGAREGFMGGRVRCDDEGERDSSFLSVEFKMLRPERVSRARNEDSCKFLNSYSTLNPHRVSQRRPVDSARPVPESGAEAILAR